MGVCGSAEAEESQAADETNRQAEEAKRKAEERQAEDAERAELEKQADAAAAEQVALEEKQARLIQIIIQCSGEADTEVTVDSAHLVLESINTACKLPEQGKRVVEAYLGELLLEGKSAWAPQGVVSGAEVGVIVEQFSMFVVADSKYHRLHQLKEDGTLIRTLGCKGSLAGQFNSPSGMAAVDRDEHILVADSGNHRLQILAKDGAHTGSIGHRGSGPGQFIDPSDVAVGEDGNILVADKNNHRLQLLAKDGTHIWSIGSEGKEPGQFKYPCGVTIDRDGNILVVDKGNDRLQVLTKDGAHIRTIGRGVGGINGSFLNPYGVAVNGDGEILVVDSGNHRLQILARNGTHIRSIGQMGSQPVSSNVPDIGFAQFRNPRAVALDHEGNIVVADWNNHRLQILSKDGVYIRTITQQFLNPSGVVVVSR